jgi:outer membrane protein insertion porin family
MRRIPFLLFVALFLFGASVASGADSNIVRSIEFQGLSKMRPSRILQYMRTKIGDPFEEQVFARDIDVVKSWMHFEYVRPTIDRREDGVRINIEMKEKWTVLPEVDIKYAGGVFVMKLGIRDNNFLGYHQTAMARGGYRAGGWLADILFVEPRIAGSRFGLNSLAQRDFYADPFYKTDDATKPQYTLVADRMGGKLRLDYEFHPFIRAGLAGRFYYDRIETAKDSARDEPPEIIKDRLPKTDTISGGGLWIKLGQTYFDNYIYRGVTLEAQGFIHDKAIGASDNFYLAQGDLRGYLPLPYGMNATARLFGGHENSGLYLEEFTLGGLENLRGYPDRRFRGKGIANANFEYRWFAGSWWWFSFMPVALADAGTQWRDSLKEIDADRDIHVGAGGGFRLIVNKFDNSILRFDVAWPVAQTGSPDFNFGMDMFF